MNNSIAKQASMLESLPDAELAKMAKRPGGVIALMEIERRKKLRAGAVTSAPAKTTVVDDLTAGIASVPEMSMGGVDMEGGIAGYADGGLIDDEDDADPLAGMEEEYEELFGVAGDGFTPVPAISAAPIAAAKLSAKQGAGGMTPHQAMLYIESRGRDYDANGNPLTSSAGAMYSRQVMPKTAARPGYGIKPAADNSAKEFNRVGDEYLSRMINEFGDPLKGAAAYNAGAGNVNRAIRKARETGRDWIEFLPKETRNYVHQFASLTAPRAYAEGGSVEEVLDSDLYPWNVEFWRRGSQIPFENDSPASRGAVGGVRGATYYNPSGNAADPQKEVEARKALYAQYGQDTTKWPTSAIRDLYGHKDGDFVFNPAALMDLYANKNTAFSQNIVDKSEYDAQRDVERAERKAAAAAATQNAPTTKPPVTTKTDVPPVAPTEPTKTIDPNAGIAGYLKMLKEHAGEPDNTYSDRMKRMMEKIERSDPTFNDILIRGGLAMAAGKDPRALANLAGGMTQGLNYYDQQKAANQKALLGLYTHGELAELKRYALATGNVKLAINADMMQKRIDAIRERGGGGMQGMLYQQWKKENPNGKIEDFISVVNGYKQDDVARKEYSDMAKEYAKSPDALSMPFNQYLKKNHPDRYNYFVRSGLIGEGSGGARNYTYNSATGKWE